jgi:methyl-accepting chemotaxis protein
MQFFRDMSVRMKLFGGFGVVLALTTMLGVMSISSLSSVNQKGTSIYSSNVLSLNQLGTANTAFTDEQRLVLRGIVYAHDQTIQQQVETGIAADQATFEQNVNAFAGAGLSPTESAAIAVLRPAVASYLPLRDQVRSLTRAGQLSAAGAANSKGVVAFTAIQSSLLKMIAFNKAEAASAAKDIASTYSSSRTQTIALLVISLMIGMAIAFLVSRSIKRAVDVALDRLTSLGERCMAYLNEGMQALAAGDLTRSYEPVTAPIENPAKDELGQIASAINGMRDRIVASLQAYNKTAGRLREVIGDVAKTADSVGHTSHEIAASSEETGKATGEIAHAVGDVAQGAERQVQMIETARSAAEDVARGVAESAESANQAAEVAQNTRKIAQEGVGAADQANEAMVSVKDSSEEVTQAIRGLAGMSGQIGAIVATITGIAEQTNLLALNAAIEAARAGEQGRGFAVVAEEVRKLAEESQHAAQEISVLIGAIQNETTKAVGVVEAGAKRTADGASVVEKTREAFQRIESSVDDMTARIEQIAAASQQMAASANSMQESIGEVAAVAEQSSASTEEVSASTEQTSASAQQIAASASQLSGNAEELNRLVAQFKTAA